MPLPDATVGEPYQAFFDRGDLKVYVNGKEVIPEITPIDGKYRYRIHGSDIDATGTMTFKTPSGTVVGTADIVANPASGD